MTDVAVRAWRDTSDDLADPMRPYRGLKQEMVSLRPIRTPADGIHRSALHPTGPERGRCGKSHTGHRPRRPSSPPYPQIRRRHAAGHRLAKSFFEAHESKVRAIIMHYEDL